MRKNLYQIVTELYARPVEGEDLYVRIRNVGEEIRKVVQSEETMSGRFHGLLESFRGIIPDEQQRYQAALKALSTTSKLSQKEVINAMNSELEGLKVLEKGLMPSQAGWQGEMQSMEARSHVLKGEMASLRARIAQLESEEQLIRDGITVRVKYLELAEKTVKELFANIGAEIAALKKKVQELPAEGTAARPIPSPVQQTSPAQQPISHAEKTIPVRQTLPAQQLTSHAEKTMPQKVPLKDNDPGKQEESGEQKVEITAEPVTVDSKFQRKCPQCGGQFNLLEIENMWQCFTCGHEEPSSGAVTGTGGPAEGSRSVLSEGSDVESSSFEAKRPSSKYPDVEWSSKGPASSKSQKWTKKKDCPVCRKKMFWYPDDKAWRCPSCKYERRI